MHNFGSLGKAMAVILLAYSLTAGMLIPLKPGIVNVMPDRLKCNTSAWLKVEGYNTFYLRDPRQWKAYLKLGTSDSSRVPYLLFSDSVEVASDTELFAHFNFPAHLPGHKLIASASLILDHPTQGSSVIPGKILLVQDSLNDSLGRQFWTLPADPHFHAFKSLAFPYRNILYETIRNTFYHVSLWFAMFLMFGLSVYQSVKYLRQSDIEADHRAHALVVTGILFGLLGCATGSLWAKYTWDAWWTRDIKLNTAALTMLIYFSYLILRSSIEDRDRRARISAAYNIFALAAAIPLIFILPRLTDSLHPGSGGNPAFGSEDMDNTLRMVFYPAVIGFMLLGIWISNLLYRIIRLEYKLGVNTKA